MITDEVAADVVYTQLRQTLALLGERALDALQSPECDADVRCYVAAARGVAAAMARFRGSDTEALELENAAVLYRQALRRVRERIQIIALDTLQRDRVH